ncbi:MAG: MFS transporter [Desulfobacterales bacterium]|nr:MFS transporter [Desulfobacterales bacterium]
MNKNLYLLLSGQLISQIGDKFHMLAVAFLVLKTTGSPAKMGLVLFCSVFPAMLLGFISGAFLDRYSRKIIIVSADVIRGLIVSALCALYYLGVLSFAMLLVAQLLLSVCTAFFDPAIPAIIPQIVKRDQLTQANSQAQFISGIATIIGPTLGGLMVAWTGYLPIFIINAGSYLFSACFEGFIRLPALNTKATVKSRILDDIIEGCRYVFSRKRLLIILLMVGVIHFFVGSIEAVIPVFATDLKGGGAENIGFIQTCFGLGTVLAALFISIRNINDKEVLFLFGSVFLIGLLLLMISLLHLAGIRIVAPFLVFFLAIGAAVILAGTSFRSILQKDVEAMLMGRVFGFVSSVGNISIPLAILVFGLLMEYVHFRAILAVSGFALLPLSILAHNKYVATISEPQHGEPVV